MSLEGVVFLHPVEAVVIDSASLNAFGAFCQPGAKSFAADDLVEDFVVCLSSVESAWEAGEFDRLACQARMLVEISDSLGLDQSALIAGHLLELCGGRDDVALAAVTARVVRVGEASLASVLEHAYRRI